MLIHEPYKIKSVRNIPFTTFNERKRVLLENFFNVVLIPVEKVTFDMITQGTSAMSQEQVAALFIGDEAYAGAVNFYNLEKTVREVFGLMYTCPTHNRYGNVKLLTSIFVKNGKEVYSNVLFPKEIVEYYKGEFFLLNSILQDDYVKIDSSILESILNKKDKIAYIYIDLRADNGIPIDFNSLVEFSRVANEANINLVLDTSHIVLYSNFLKHKYSEFKHKKIREILKDITKLAKTVSFDAGQDARCNGGGFLATNDQKHHELHQNEVVIYEGLHTYGGMAGRTMEVIAVGLRDMINDDDAIWYNQQVDLLSNILKENEVPHHKGIDGVYIHADKFLEHIKENHVHTLAASLYLKAGIRAGLWGKITESNLLPIQLPRRALLNTQIAQIAEAIVQLYRERKFIPPLRPLSTPLYHNEAKFDWSIPVLTPYEFDCEPYIIHSIERIAMKSYEERKKAMEEAGYNTFLLKMEDVTIDLLTDSGTAAMSVEQWKAYLGARETPNISDAYLELVKTAQKIYGYKYIILTHQGRAAEHIMSQMFIKPGDYVPGNMYFTTTKQHQEMAGGIFVDVIIDEAHDPESTYEWKGNIDLKKLEAIYEKAKSEGRRVAYISFEFNVNLAGGQPVSMDNLKEVYEFCKPRGIPVFFDATRCAENAIFIKERDPRYKDATIEDIILEMFSYGDGATISAKKDMLTNLSGALLFKDNEEWYKEALRMVQIFEGSHSSGGTLAGDIATHAQGIKEMVDERYIRSRVRQVRYLAQLLIDAGIPIVLPPGGHAVFIDAKKFLPHIDQDQFPAQTLAAHLFIETGVRAMERGNVSKGRDPVTGKNYRPKLELVRLTIPRRVYSLDHLKAVADGIIRLYQKRETIRGLEFTYEPKALRFFQARFRLV